MIYTLEQAAKLTLFDVLENSAKTYTSKVALSMVGQEPMSFTQLLEKSKKLSFHFHKLGISKGDKVAIWSVNKPNWLVAFFSLARLGAIAVPILPDFSPKEVKNILEHSGARIIIISWQLYRKMGEELKDAIDELILMKDFTIRVKENNELVKTDKFQPFCDQDDEEYKSFIPEKPNLNDLASIIYTSGTTGSSKGVMLTHQNLVVNAVQGTKIFQVLPHHSFLSILPLSHALEFTVGGILPLLSGASIHYIDKPPTANVLLPALKKVQPTCMLLVPLIIEKIYRSKIRPALTESSLKKTLMKIPAMRKLLHKVAGKRLMATFGGKIEFFGIGGAKLDEQTEIFLHDAGFPYAIGYGLTETSPLIAGCPPGKTRVGSTGPIIKGLEIKLLNPDKNTGEGEIAVKGLNVMKGYYRNEAVTKEVFTDDGYFRTGDTGTFDKDGNLYIKGRIKTMILGASGENIYPEIIEAQINNSEWVLESLVSQVKGQLVARISLNYDAIEKQWEQIKDSTMKMEEYVEKILNDLKSNINNELNKFSKISKFIEQKGDFVKTPTKKIKRYLYDNHEDNVAAAPEENGDEQEKK